MKIVIHLNPCDSLCDMHTVKDGLLEELRMIVRQAPFNNHVQSVEVLSK